VERKTAAIMSVSVYVVREGHMASSTSCDGGNQRKAKVLYV
jgi:hypothetical protein